MNLALELGEWFLAQIGKARATELAKSNRAGVTKIRRHRMAAASRLVKRLNKKQTERGTPQECLTPDAAKALLKSKGWSYRTVAPVLNVHFTHLDRVLNGERISNALLKRIEALPKKGAEQ